jgi:hypothetical protein
MQRWRDVNDRMCRLGQGHAEYHRKYAGMNQASFGELLETGGFDGLSVLELPCAEWNCCEWLQFSDQTRVVHVKSRLRRAVFLGGDIPMNLVPIADLWHRLERDALAAEVRP